jgi:hypothetical protein
MTGNGDKAGHSASRSADPSAVSEAASAAEEQGLLFDDDVSPLPSDAGYRGPTACNAAGITYRQLDYWARTGLVEPTVRGATGSGTQRLYSFREIRSAWGHDSFLLRPPGYHETIAAFLDGAEG